MQLNTVVLPAPFGPMIAVISRGRAPKETSSTASRPPKRIGEMLDLDQRRGVFGSSWAGAHRMQPHRRLAMGDQARAGGTP
jgi:hypothetical protein